MIAELKKNGDYNKSDYLTKAFTQQLYDTAENIATVA